MDHCSTEVLTSFVIIPNEDHSRATTVTLLTICALQARNSKVGEPMLFAVEIVPTGEMGLIQNLHSLTRKISPDYSTFSSKCIMGTQDT